MQPQSFQTNMGPAVFSKVSLFEGQKRRKSVNDRRNRGKSYAF